MVINSYSITERASSCSEPSAIVAQVRDAKVNDVEHVVNCESRA
jgi:hypothetical protein